MAEEVNSVIMMSYMPFAVPEMLPSFIESLAHLSTRLDLPIYLVPPYAATAGDAMKALTLSGLPAFPSFERAARALSATYRWQARVSMF